MSHANGEVIENGQVTGYFEYNGTSDICTPWIYDTYQEMSDNWRRDSWHNCGCFQYKEKDILAVKHDKENTKVTSYAESVPMYEGLPPVYALDIAEDSSGELKVLEVGAINVSGLYGCDPEPIIKAIVEETEKIAYVHV